MNCDKKDLLLYAVTDRSWLGEHTLYEQVEAAIRGGATFVQLREKSWIRNPFWQRPGRFRRSAAGVAFPL